MTEDLRNLILREIRRIAESKGGTAPGKMTFARATGITEGQWAGRFWARWSDALREAGFSPNQLQVQHAATDLLRPVALFTKRLGRLPTKLEMRLERRRSPDVPNPTTIENRFGSRSRLIVALRDWARAHPGHVDLLSIIPGDHTSVQDPPCPAASPEGFVYLLKSGPN